ncbi:ribonucleotide reductase [Pseudomonas alcaligenes]|uniref:Ribonucleotide reductase n=1 Tax=Aquipseudomonas alcaligenes TaxID=43263 RepID=A0ABR7S8F1_AQUAC|nr:DUF2388 domain-containing protein [Pseudomonas alcaligenes]MBC9252738.1 ribonucleotide reductase [Pseudomonas alcaligenes]
MCPSRRLAVLLLLALLIAPVLAHAGFWRDVLSSGALTASTYLTVKDDKQRLATRDEASAFVASAGQIRGAHLQAALQRLRAEHPQLQASDEELAQALLIQGSAPPTH